MWMTSPDSYFLFHPRHRKTVPTALDQAWDSSTRAACRTRWTDRSSSTRCDGNWPPASRWAVRWPRLSLEIRSSISDGLARRSPSTASGTWRCCSRSPSPRSVIAPIPCFPARYQLFRLIKLCNHTWAQSFARETQGTLCRFNRLLPHRSRRSEHARIAKDKTRATNCTKWNVILLLFFTILRETYWIILCVPFIHFLYASVYLNANVRAAASASRALWLRVEEIIDGVSLKSLLVDPGYHNVAADHHALLRIRGYSEGHVLPGIYHINSTL